MRKSVIILIGAALVMYCNPLHSNPAKSGRSISVSSPSGTITVAVSLDQKLVYEVSYKQNGTVFSGEMSMTTDAARLGVNPQMVSHKIKTVSETITPVVAYKFSEVDNTYTLLTMKFRGGYSVELRAYDDGVAYRFVTSRKGMQEIVGEEMLLDFAKDAIAHLQLADNFYTAYEEPYAHMPIADWKAGDKMATLPALFESAGCKVLVSEADLKDYPCMFLKGGASVNAFFCNAALENKQHGDRWMEISKEADYIAHTQGTRSFPWRYMFITDDDRRIAENTMTLKLSRQDVTGDTSWIKPGQVSWEWWNGASAWGPDVDFSSGFNLETYKYFIDFASANGIEYIIMDEGWAASTEDPYAPNPRVDVHELIAYGKEKNVGIILWLTWIAVEKNMELFETFSGWGVKGVKIDFMNRSDQWMVNYYERVAAEAAKHHILVNFHGSFKPAGLEYRYPNVLSYEGVRGLEQMGGCRPENTLWLPFMRNAVGPMDFTPGAMLNMQPECYNGNRPNAGGMGTRAFQMALFVIFESGLQMLADSPTNYYRFQECTDFIASVPVTWDETRVLEAQGGKVILTAKRKGDKWYIGGITGEDEYKTTLSLDFLTPGQSYSLTSFTDGPNSRRQGMDYRRMDARVNASSVIEIEMVRNGGFAAVIE